MNASVNGDGAGGAKRRRAPRPTLVILSACGTAGFLFLLIFLGMMPPVAGFLAVAVVVLTIFWSVRDHLPAILLVFVSVLLVTVIITEPAPRVRNESSSTLRTADELAQQWKESGKFDSRLPIVVHMIFDELMSPGAMTDDLPDGATTRRAVEAFRDRHSFRMFDSVYSRFFFSGMSIPNMMDREYRGQTKLSDVFTTQVQMKTSNPYFDEMAARGYRTVVFQSAIMNFCENRNVDQCETFDSFNPGGGGDTGLDSRNQRASLWQTIVRAYQPSYTSDAGQDLLRRVYGLNTKEVGVIGAADRYDVQRFPEWIERFTAFVAQVPRGSHVFAHFMAPHSPYLLTEDCVVSGRFEGGYYLKKNYPPEQRVEKRRQFYASYLAQLRCVQRKLDDFMATVNEAESFRDAVIIIHGDHGSRISSGNIVEDYASRDLVDNYATFFAVRAPGVPPGVDCEFVSLPEVFRRYAGPKDAAPLSTGPPLPVFAVSRDAGDQVVEAPMPLFGCAMQSLVQ